MVPAALPGVAGEKLEGTQAGRPSSAQVGLLGTMGEPPGMKEDKLQKRILHILKGETVGNWPTERRKGKITCQQLILHKKPHHQKLQKLCE